MAIWITVILAAMLFWAQQKIFQKLWSRRLAVTLQFGKQGMEAGESCELKEVIRNEKRLPLPALQVKFAASASFRFEDDANAVTTDQYYRNDLFSVGGRQQVTRTLMFQGTQRGYYQIPEIQLSTQDYFFSERFAQIIPNQTALYVYPAKLSLLPFQETYRQILGELIAKMNLQEDPFYFRGIRPYQPYDPMKHINWKSSARHNELLVNTFEHTYSQDVCILLNLSSHSVIRKREMQEFAISIASTLAERFLRDGIPVAVSTNGWNSFLDKPVQAPRGAGKAYRITIDRQLAQLDLDQPVGDFCEVMERECQSGRTNVQYLCISSEHSPAVLSCFSRLRKKRPDLYMIVPEAQDEKWELQDGMVGWEVEQLG